MIPNLVSVRGLLRSREARAVAVAAMALEARAVAVVAMALALSAATAGLSAQTATASTEENLRAEPNGVVLARIHPGTVLSVEETDGAWVRATLEGWVWRPSLEATDREGFDLRVSAEGGENLRVEPQGTVLARLEEGMLLEEIERSESWIRVRRSAWIWRASVDLDDEDGEEPPASGSVAERAERAADGWRSAGEDGTAILSAPDGDTVARTRPGGELRILGRRGNWARIRMEGWAWLPPTGAEDGDPTVLTDVDPDDVDADPERYRGRLVAWELQFVSREEAEAIRTDFYEGEPYLLTRHPEGRSRFVYVAVPPDRVEEIGQLRPLERIVVTGRIRTGRAQLTGGPILELLELSRVEDGPGGAGR